MAVQLRSVERTWMGSGREDFCIALEKADRWIHSQRLDRFYDEQYALRRISCVFRNKTISWTNREFDLVFSDFMEKASKLSDNMYYLESWYIHAEYSKFH